MESLGWWLILVGSLRLASVWFGFFNIPRLRSGVYGRTSSKRIPLAFCLPSWVFWVYPVDIGKLKWYTILNHIEFAMFFSDPLFGKLYAVTAVHGRTFAIWTLVTCTLCYTCAFNLDNKPLYLVTLLSFIYALVHFLMETLVYQTMSIANLTTVSFFAGTSIVWMVVKWN
ncbi:Ergosterol biosynthetic protein 28 [Linum perenne]